MRCGRFGDYAETAVDEFVDPRRRVPRASVNQTTNLLRSADVTQIGKRVDGFEYADLGRDPKMFSFTSDGRTAWVGSHTVWPSACLQFCVAKNREQLAREASRRR
jgi:hypothetical protein